MLKDLENKYYVEDDYNSSDCLINNSNFDSSYLEQKDIKIFFGNLAPITTENQMYSLFNKYGKCYNLVILKDRKHRSRGSGFVTFTYLRDAYSAISNLNRKITLDGSHTPLEVRFPENKAQKKERIKHLKEHKAKQDSIFHLMDKNDNTLSNNLNREAFSLFMKNTLSLPFNQDSAIEVSSNDSTESHISTNQLNNMQCKSCGTKILAKQSCFDCLRGVYTH